jgi:hypothetical protein
MISWSCGQVCHAMAGAEVLKVSTVELQKIFRGHIWCRWIRLLTSGRLVTHVVSVAGDNESRPVLCLVQWGSYMTRASIELVSKQMQHQVLKTVLARILGSKKVLLVNSPEKRRGQKSKVGA